MTELQEKIINEHLEWTANYCNNKCYDCAWFDRCNYVKHLLCPAGKCTARKE
jgi:hypothetical protein